MTISRIDILKVFYENIVKSLSSYEKESEINVLSKGDVSISISYDELNIMADIIRDIIFSGAYGIPNVTNYLISSTLGKSLGLEKHNFKKWIHCSDGSESISRVKYYKKQINDWFDDSRNMICDNDINNNIKKAIGAPSKINNRRHIFNSTVSSINAICKAQGVDVYDFWDGKLARLSDERAERKRAQNDYMKQIDNYKKIIEQEENYIRFIEEQLSKEVSERVIPNNSKDFFEVHEHTPLEYVEIIIKYKWETLHESRLNILRDIKNDLNYLEKSKRSRGRPRKKSIRVEKMDTS